MCIHIHLATRKFHRRRDVMKIITPQNSAIEIFILKKINANNQLSSTGHGSLYLI